MGRAKGISTLVACQNEEATVGWCILSFLEFSDEIIVVDNGSTDASKEICREIARQYPEKVSFYDVPHLKDLYENRQYALERSRYNWIVRADADYICYTNGEYDCRNVREFLLSRRLWHRPFILKVKQPSVHGDFWHTAAAETPNRERWPMALFQVDPPMKRIYPFLPGMRFARLGRWEGVRYPRALERFVTHLTWDGPIWMHCNIKSDMNFFARSERTNWRESGDFARYPTLESFLRGAAVKKFQTSDLDEAARLYTESQVLPQLQRYDPVSLFPYPSVAQQAMKLAPCYKIKEGDESRQRKYLGPIDLSESTTARIGEGLVGSAAD